MQEMLVQTPLLPFLSVLAQGSPQEPTATSTVFLHDQSDAPPRPGRATTPWRRQAQSDPWVLFLNFDGAMLQTCGYNDPKTNCTTRNGGGYEPFSRDQAIRASIAQATRKDVAPFNIVVTDKRPADTVEYDMEMIGDFSSRTFPEGVGGIAPDGYDCDNARGADISFTFDTFGSIGERPMPLGIIKSAVLQELAHSWGLEHCESQLDLLFPVASTTQDRSFVDECFQITTSPVETGSAQAPTNARCPEMHSRNCSEANHQNSHLDMLDLFGPATPDMNPPTVAILHPEEAEEVPRDFEILVSLSDTQSPQIFDVTLYLDGESAVHRDYGIWELAFPAAGLTDGEHVVRVEAIDEQGNLGSDEVTFRVGESGPETTTGSEGTGTNTSTSSGASTTGAESSATTGTDSSAGTTTDDSGDEGRDEGSDTDPGQDTGASACGCRAAPTGWLSIVLPLLPLTRRRAQSGRGRTD